MESRWADAPNGDGWYYMAIRHQGTLPVLVKGGHFLYGGMGRIYESGSVRAKWLVIGSPPHLTWDSEEAQEAAKQHGLDVTDAGWDVFIRGFMEGRKR